MRFWVAGATGFLGKHLVKTLLEEGHEVVATSRGGGQVHGVNVLAVDVMVAEQVEASARGCDGAFFAAGKVSREPADAGLLHRLHVDGTREALRALRDAGVPRVVYVSTSGTIAVTTDGRAVPDETAAAPMDLIARWPYYRSKLFAEREALACNTPGRFEVVVVNPSLLLGPGDSRGSSTEDVRRFLAGEVIAVPRGGLAFVDVRDAVQALLSAFHHGVAGERYLVSAVNLTVAAFLQRLSRLSGKSMPLLRLPASAELAVVGNQWFSKVVRKLGGTPPLDDASVEMAQHFWYCDASKAERVLGFSPRDPGTTLRDTIADLRGEYEELE